MLAQEVPGAHHVVDPGDLVIDVLHPGMRRREERELVVYGVDAQERCRADAVGHAGVAHARPERLVAGGVGRAQPDVGEAGDAGLAARHKVAVGDARAMHELDRVAGGVRESQEPFDAAHLALVARAPRDRQVAGVDLRGGGVERGGVVDVEADRMIGRVALEVREGVIAPVASKVTGAAFVPRMLEPRMDLA